MNDDRLLDEAALLVQWTKAPTPLDWGGMLFRPGMRAFSPRETSAAGTGPGIYGLSAVDGGVLYIGKASNLNARLRHHRDEAKFRGGLKFAFYCFVAVPAYALRGVEVAHIHALEPAENRLYEPAYWRGHAAMVAALRQLWRDAS